MAYVRVVNVEQPVETHVNTQRDVDKVFVLLLQAVVDGRQAVDDVGNRKQLAIVGEFVLLKGVLGHAEVQQVHCRWGREDGDKGGSGRKEVETIMRRQGGQLIGDVKEKRGGAQEKHKKRKSH